MGASITKVTIGVSGRSAREDAVTNKAEARVAHGAAVNRKVSDDEDIQEDRP